VSFGPRTRVGMANCLFPPTTPEGAEKPLEAISKPSSFPPKLVFLEIFCLLRTMLGQLSSFHRMVGFLNSLSPI